MRRQLLPAFFFSRGREGGGRGLYKTKPTAVYMFLPSHGHGQDSQTAGNQSSYTYTYTYNIQPTPPPPPPPAHMPQKNKTPTTTTTSPTFQLDNLNNRLSGTLALLSTGYAAQRSLNAQLSQRSARRRRLVGSIRGDPDRKDRADKDAKMFALDMAGLTARAADLEEALRAWERDVGVLRRMLAGAEVRAGV